MSRNERQPRKQLINAIKEFTGKDISEPLSWSFVVEHLDMRIGNVLGSAVEMIRMQRIAVFTAAIVEFQQENQRLPNTVLELSDQTDAIDPSSEDRLFYVRSFAEDFPTMIRQRVRSFRLRL